QPIALLLGRKGISIENVDEKISIKDVTLLGGTSLENVKAAFNTHDVAIVIMGAGIDLNKRIEIVEYIFNTSKSTTVHMKDWNSGPQGMTPFIDRILNGLLD
ncbi:MAG: hypothetical protein GY761_15270, partial [Hyphomicrobiales bacterium]|nr:hypothetical protein [Hyphomicrobiales bacterium]